MSLVTSAGSALSRPNGLVGGSASKTRAMLARSDYNDWLMTFKPIEDQLLGQYGNEALRSLQQVNAVKDTQTGLANADGAYQRRLQGYGIQLTPEQQAAQQRDSNLTAGLANVNAWNMAGRRFDESQQMLLTGAMPQRGGAQA